MRELPKNFLHVLQFFLHFFQSILFLLLNDQGLCIFQNGFVHHKFCYLFIHSRCPWQWTSLLFRLVWIKHRLFVTQTVHKQKSISNQSIETGVDTELLPAQTMVTVTSWKKLAPFQGWPIRQELKWVTQ